MAAKELGLSLGSLRQNGIGEAQEEGRQRDEKSESVPRRDSGHGTSSTISNTNSTYVAVAVVAMTAGRSPEPGLTAGRSEAVALRT